MSTGSFSAHYLTPRHHRETACRGELRQEEISKNKVNCPMVSKQDLLFYPHRRCGLNPDTRYSAVSLRLRTETSLDKTITHSTLTPGRASRYVFIEFVSVLARIFTFQRYWKGGKFTVLWPRCWISIKDGGTHAAVSRCSYNSFWIYSISLVECILKTGSGK